GGRVKCSAMHVPACAPDEPLGARQHLVSGASGERQEENPLRPHAAIHEVGHTVHKRARLAAPSACDDQQRAVPMRRRRELVRVKLRGEIATASGRRHDALMQRNNSAAIVRHTRNIPEDADVSRAGLVTSDIAFPPTPTHAPNWWSCAPTRRNGGHTRRRPPTRRIGGRARRRPTTRRMGGRARRRPPNDAPNWWSCATTPKRRAELVVMRDDARPRAKLVVMRRARILPRLAPLRAIEIG